MSVNDDRLLGDDGDDDHEDGRGAVYLSERPDRHRTRRRIMVGVLALAAVLGPVAFFVTGQVLKDRKAAAPLPEPVTVAPASPTATVKPSGTPPAAARSTEPSRPARDSVRRTSSPKPTTASPTPSGSELPGGVSIAEAPVSERSETIRGGTIKVVSAKYNLTGLREMRIPADGGRPVGKARCTQRIHAGNDSSVQTVESMLVCWRTSDERSVVTIAVSASGRPSAPDSVAVIDREWSKLG